MDLRIADFMTGVDISDKDALRICTVTWNLENIIEVYDHYTPRDSPEAKSDDIFILADRFWERFSLTAQIYSD